VDAAAEWGVDGLPETPGRDADAIVAAALSGDLAGLVVGGVDPDDTADPAAFRAALDAASYVVALELRETDVTRAADVVFPVAPVADKAGTFVTWEGRPRPFDVVLGDPGVLPDARVLAGVAEELGRPLGFRHSLEARARMEQMGPWDGERAPMSVHRPGPPLSAADRSAPSGSVRMRLATWKQMLDLGSMQDGEKHLRATARTPVALLPEAVARAMGDHVTLTGDRGSIDLPVRAADLPEGVVWVPARSTGRGVLADLASPGSTVTVRGTT